MSNPFRSIPGTAVISTIMDALRAVGYAIPDDTKSVIVDSETEPTYVKVDGVKQLLDDADRALVVQAIQLHKVRHRVGTSANG